MKTILFSALLFTQAVWCHSLFARLGEDEIQCEERYGFAKKEYISTDKINPLVTGDGANIRTYIYQGWRIRIGFLDGVAVREEYWKVTGPGRTAAIADYESTAILDGEKGSATWQTRGTTLSLNVTKMLQDHLQNVLMGTHWIRSDGAATATLDLGKMHLLFESLAAIQHDEAIKQANDQKQRASVPTF